MVKQQTIGGGLAILDVKKFSHQFFLTWSMTWSSKMWSELSNVDRASSVGHWSSTLKKNLNHKNEIVRQYSENDRLIDPIQCLLKSITKIPINVYQNYSFTSMGTIYRASILLLGERLRRSTFSNEHTWFAGRPPSHGRGRHLFLWPWCPMTV